MKEWCLIHPVMTFLLVLAVVFTIDNALANYFKGKK